jgi:hypothetical protein
MRIFFACPFSKYLALNGGPPTLDAGFAAFLVRVETALSTDGHEVFLAHRVEEFGAKLRPPHICTPCDMLELQRADCVVALPDDSYGVHIELGWATAMNKPIILLLPNRGPATTPLLQGLGSVARCTILQVPDDLRNDVAGQERVIVSLRQQMLSAVARTDSRDGCAFVGGSVGRGSAATAVAIAAEIKRRAPHLATHYFGTGAGAAVAQAASAIDRVYCLDTAEPHVADLIPLLTPYQIVFSIRNLALLPRWTHGRTPLYLVDNRRGPWSQPPRGAANLRRCFLQDYLLATERVDQWRSVVPTELIAPVETTADSAGSASSVPAAIRPSVAGDYACPGEVSIVTRVFEDAGRSV